MKMQRKKKKKELCGYCSNVEKEPQTPNTHSLCCNIMHILCFDLQKIFGNGNTTTKYGQFEQFWKTLSETNLKPIMHVMNGRRYVVESNDFLLNPSCCRYYKNRRTKTFLTILISGFKKTLLKTYPVVSIIKESLYNKAS